MNTLTCPVCGSSSLTHFLDCIDYAVSRESFSLQKCQQCELLTTTPQPSENELPKYYQFEDYVSHTSKATNLINKIYLLARRYTLRQKRKLISKYSNTGALLDIGCGTGNFLDECQRAGWKVAGIEPSEGARKIALDVTENISPSIAEHKGNNYNVITLWHVLEHLSDLNGSLEKIREMLGTNGTIFIAVPNYKSYDGQFYSKLWAGYDVPRHLWHFSEVTMKALVEKHQLRLTKIIPMKLDAYYVSLLSEKYRAGKLTPMAMINAIKNGFVSNNRASENTNYSSLIYVIKK